jgi:hypothetical protein
VKTINYRVTNLRVTPRGAGCAYEAWIKVGDVSACYRGTVSSVKELEPSVLADLARAYTKVTGEPFPDRARA